MVADLPVLANDEIECWARHAQSANGFGDIANADMASTRPTSYALYHAARAHRSFILGRIIIAAIRAAAALAFRARERRRQRQQAWATYCALRELDDRTLRDIGFDSSERRPAAAEATGEAQHDRERALLMSHGLPKRTGIIDRCDAGHELDQSHVEYALGISNVSASWRS